MENRRIDYRHTFEEPERLPVSLHVGAAELHGEVLDLSVAGMAVRLDEPAAIRPRDRLHVDLSLAGDQKVALPAVVVHGQQAPTPHLGLRFLPAADLQASDARDRLLWRFLVAQQQRERRLRAIRPDSAKIIRKND